MTDHYLRPYQEAVRHFGAGFHATLWSSKEAQQLRFDVIINFAELEHCVILDAGCGTGDLAEHLHFRGINFERYVGIDALPELIGEARTRALPRCEFIQADLLRDRSALGQIEPDFVCISGTLNTMDEIAARDLVEAAYKAAKQGVIFNFLSDRQHEKWNRLNTGPARRFNTVQWLEWAMGLTSRVSFTQDYLDGHDATFMMRRE